MSLKDRIKERDEKDINKFGNKRRKSTPNYVRIQRVEISGIMWTDMKREGVSWFGYNELKQKLLLYANDDRYFSRVYHRVEDFIRTDVEKVIIFPSGVIHIFPNSTTHNPIVLEFRNSKFSFEMWEKVVDFALTHGGKVIR